MLPDVLLQGRNHLALIDLDGVVCDDRHRVHFALSRNWGDYFVRMVDDAVWPQGRQLVDAVIYAGWDLAYLTGRREDTRLWTVDWLRRRHYPVDVPLLMRPQEDRRKLAELKADVVSRLVQDGRQVWMYDDDPNVIERVSRVPGAVARHCTWHVKEQRLVNRGKS